MRMKLNEIICTFQLCYILIGTGSLKLRNIGIEHTYRLYRFSTEKQVTSFIYTTPTQCILNPAGRPATGILVPPLQGQHCVRLTWPLKVVSHRTGFDPGSTFGAGYYATQLLSTTKLGREPVPLDLLAVQTDASQNELSRGVSGKTTRTSLIGIGSLRTVE